MVPLAFLIENSALPALMVERSKAPPLTARCLSPLSWFESHARHVRKLPVTWC